MGLRVWLGVDWVDVVPREITGRNELVTAGRLGCARARAGRVCSVV